MGDKLKFLVDECSEQRGNRNSKRRQHMRKQRIEYGSPLDALVAIAKRLSVFEMRHQIPSEDFFDKFRKGEMEDSEDFVEWANDYRQYMGLRSEMEELLRNAA